MDVSTLDSEPLERPVSATNIIPLPTHREQRLVDEMALALLGVGALGSDDACVMALLGAGFRGKDIGHHLDAARELAREAEVRA
jgi:hypothetical protein